MCSGGARPAGHSFACVPAAARPAPPTERFLWALPASSARGVSGYATGEAGRGALGDFSSCTDAFRAGKGSARNSGAQQVAVCLSVSPPGSLTPGFLCGFGVYQLAPTRSLCARLWAHGEWRSLPRPQGLCVCPNFSHSGLVTHHCVPLQRKSGALSGPWAQREHRLLHGGVQPGPPSGALCHE